MIFDPVANDVPEDRHKDEDQDDPIASKVFAKPAICLWCREEENLLFRNAANHLIPKAFNPNITSALSVDIAIAEANLVEHIVGDSGIVEAGSMVEEVVRIGHHRRLSSLVTSYEVRAVAYCLHSIEILTKHTDLGTIAVTDKEPYNLTAVGVYTAIDLNAEARQLIMTV